CRRQWRAAIALISICLVGFPAAARATMEIQALDNAGANPPQSLINQYDRFQNGANFIGIAYNWSGVGQAYESAPPNQVEVNGSWATMISPSYFISANHFNPVNLNGQPPPNNTNPYNVLRFSYTNDTQGGYEEYSNLQTDARHYTEIGQIGDGDL